jgi:hypothetical protein
VAAVTLVDLKCGMDLISLINPSDRSSSFYKREKWLYDSMALP